MHNLLKRKYKEYKKERYEFIERQLKIVLEKYNAEEDPWIKLPTDYMLTVYYDQDKYDLAEKNKIITKIVENITRKESKRLTLYFLTKIRRKMWKLSLKDSP